MTVQDRTRLNGQLKLISNLLMNKEKVKKALAKRFFFAYSALVREKVVICGKLLNETKGVQ